MEGSEERISELEHRTIEIIQSEQQKEIDWKKKINRASETLRTS